MRLESLYSSIVLVCHLASLKYSCPIEDLYQNQINDIVTHRVIDPNITVAASLTINKLGML